MVGDRSDEYGRQAPRYGSISSRSQGIQTLLLQTQSPTQIFSYEGHRDTELVHHNTAEHMGGDTLVNGSDDEGSGNTVLVNDLDDGSDIDSGPNNKGNDNRPRETLFHNNSHKDLPDSDATTEEGDAENMEHFDTNAESSLQRPFKPEDVRIMNPEEMAHATLPDSGTGENVAQHETPHSNFSTETNASKGSQSRPSSISSIRAASIRASGLRAASRSVSSNSDRPDDFKSDPEVTMDKVPGTLDIESNKTSRNGSEKEMCGVEDLGIRDTTKFNSVESSPQLMVPCHDRGADSLCGPATRLTSMTARQNCASLSQTLVFPDNRHNEQDDQDNIRPDATILLEDKIQCKSASHGSSSLRLQHSQSQTSVVSTKLLECEVHDDAIRVPDFDLRVQAGLPSSQKARKLVFDNMDSDVGGEESQLHALGIVDKLVWLDTLCKPEDVATSLFPPEGSLQPDTGVKGLQSLAQAAQLKAVRNKLDVFDWEDSQADEDDQTVSINARKRSSKAQETSQRSKKQKISRQPQLASERKGIQKNMISTKQELSNKKHLARDIQIIPQAPETKPHTSLGTRLRRRPCMEANASCKPRKSARVQKRLKKEDDTMKQVEESSKDLNIQDQTPANDNKRKVQQAFSEPRGSKDDVETDRAKVTMGKESTLRLVDSSAVDTELQCDGRLSLRTEEDDAAAEMWIEAFSSAENKKPLKLELVKFRRQSTLQDDIANGGKKYRDVEPIARTEHDQHFETSEQENRLKVEEMPGTGVLIESEASAKVIKEEQRSTKSHGLKEISVSKKANMKQGSKKSSSDRFCLKASMRNLESEDEVTLKQKLSLMEEDGAGKELMAQEEEVVGRGPKTRSKSQKIKIQALSIRGKKRKQAAEVRIKVDTSRDTDSKEKEPSLLTETTQDDLTREKSAARSGRSRKRKADKEREAIIEDDSESVQFSEGIAVEGPKRNGNGRMDSDASMSDSVEAHEKSVVSRRTRNSASRSEVQIEETVKPQEQKSTSDFAIEHQQVGNEVLESCGRSIMSERKKKGKVSRIMQNLSPIIVDEGKRRTRDAREIRVLFSHGLAKDAIKHQKKILAKLGGQVAASAMECTHFISNGFVRSQNMLISMAAGKTVATTLWLESCGQAHYFVDEKNYILRDDKKEREFGFSMVSSLFAARRRPLFKDFKVIICPKTTPEPKALRAIVESAGGQVKGIETKIPWSDVDTQASLIVIGNQKSLDVCSQFLVKGLKVYSEELVLDGIVTQTLDFTRYLIFEDFNKRRGLRNAVNSKATV
ncbi:hypothetical protein KP509_29G085700 [Ceratopteris richardii]|uniref:BRCT domain-containing protein n=1 Tax=Ceratopteris richardii TaxID=49495 RepID=A0A8T2R8V3_CERRI|nr:hypothetical protein KP509_29G085700 [Ceratopteris richardii]